MLMRSKFSFYKLRYSFLKMDVTILNILYIELIKHNHANSK